MAANSLGTHGVPINWHFQKDEAGYILRDSRAKALVVHADLLPQVRDGIPEGVNMPTPPEIQAAYGISPRQSEPTEGSQVWDDWLGRHETRQMEPPPPPSSMIYTSGTTGNPKGVRRQPSTPETAGKFAEMVEIAFGLSPGGDFRTVVTGPIYHAAPNTYGLWTEPGVELSADAVRKFLAGRLARYKVPNAIEFCGELPREDSGKIFKRKLRDPYWEKAGRRI
jgi:long-chain acyl-CoA synthetase